MVSFGKPYLIANFVTCAFDAHRNCLAMITKIVEPKFFHEATAKEIDALELNET